MVGSFHNQIYWALRGEDGIQLTGSELGVVHLSVVGAAALVHPRVHGRAAVAQRARAAAHVGVRGVKVLRTLEALVVVPVGVQPAVAVLPLCVRDPQVPGQVSEQQAVQQAPHPGVICSTWRSACNQRNFTLRHCHRSFPHSLKTKPPQPAD